MMTDAENNEKYVIHQLEGHIQSIYLAEYVDKILLLDGGCRCDIPAITKYITATMKRELSEVRVAILSHAHPDHAGGAPILRDLFGIPLAAHQEIDSWYSGICGRLQHVADTAMAWIVVVKTGRPFRRIWHKRAYFPDYLLKEGDTLPFFPDWRVLHLPGHTNHDIALYNEESQDLYVGDLILKVHSKYVPPFPVTMPEKMRESLKRISELKSKRLLLAHGGIVTENVNSQFFLSVIPMVGLKSKHAMKYLAPFTKFSTAISR